MFSRTTNFALSAEMYDECRVLAAQRKREPDKYPGIIEEAQLTIANAIDEAEAHWKTETAIEVGVF